MKLPGSQRRVAPLTRAERRDREALERAHGNPRPDLPRTRILLVVVAYNHEIAERHAQGRLARALNGTGAPMARAGSSSRDSTRRSPAATTEAAVAPPLRVVNQPATTVGVVAELRGRHPSAPKARAADMNDSTNALDAPTPSARPAVTVSYAQTLDGRLATRTGRSRWISCPESLHFAHELRASHDAIVVGAGTVGQDDPRLTVRLVERPAGTRDPLRVVVDSTLRTPLTVNVLARGAAVGTLLAVTERAPEERCAAARALGATVLPLPADAMGRVDLVALLAALGARGVTSVLVEGGARVITALLHAQLVDRLAICVAPKILGTGIEAIGDLGIVDLARALLLRDLRMTPYGADLVLDGYVVYPEEGHGR